MSLSMFTPSFSTWPSRSDQLEHSINSGQVGPISQSMWVSPLRLATSKLGSNTSNVTYMQCNICAMVLIACKVPQFSPSSPQRAIRKPSSLGVPFLGQSLFGVSWVCKAFRNSRRPRNLFSDDRNLRLRSGRPECTRNSRISHTPSW